MAAKHKRGDEIFEILKKPIGQAIVRFRGMMSQEGLARKAKMDAGTLRKLEKGEGWFRKEYFEGICQTFDLNLDELLRTAADCYEEAQKEQQAASYQQMSREELLRTLHKAQDAHARSRQKLDEIKREITRRLLPQAEELPTTSPEPSPNGAHEDQT